MSLTSFLGFGQDHVERYYTLTNNHVFLHIKRDKKEVGRNFFVFRFFLDLQKINFYEILQITPEQRADGPAKKITRLAIGTPGGFTPDQQKYTYEETYKIVVLPSFESVPYPKDDLPEQVKIQIIFWVFFIFIEILFW